MNWPQLNVLEWSSIEPHYTALQAATLTPKIVPAWLERWSDLEKVLYEARSRVMRAKSENTADEATEAAFLRIVEEIWPKVEVAAQGLKQKLLEQNFVPSDEERLMLKRLKVEADLFHQENIEIFSRLSVLDAEYDKTVGARTVMLDGVEQTMPQAAVALSKPDRAERERVYALLHQRRLQDREGLNRLFLEMLSLRRQVAKNAGFANYRDYAWQDWARFDYTPEDCLRFHAAIEAVVVPLASELLQRDRKGLGLEELRPWDYDWRLPLDPWGAEPLQPFQDGAQLEAGMERLFAALDPELGAQFALMRNGQMDLVSRKNKAPGAFCNHFPVSGVPYIFGNAVGTHDDVQTVLHEAGHAFHAFAFMKAQKLHWNAWGPTEFAEVGSMAMELLAQAHLEREHGGFYSAQDAARATREHLQGLVRFLPYMAIMDAFQHWLYAEAPEDIQASDLDTKWSELWDRFSPGVNWSGFEDAKASGWQKQGHLFGAPFYYVEYGIAQVGAMQLWRNSIQAPKRTLEQYKQALALGYTRGLPELFEAAGIRLAFDAATLRDVFALVRGHLKL